MYVPSDVLKEKEATTSKVFYKMAAVNHVSYSENKGNYSACDINANKHSSLRRLLRITVYCLKFIKQSVWDNLSHLTKKTIGDKYKLIVIVMNLLTDGYSVCAGDIKMAAFSGYIQFNIVNLMMSLLRLIKIEDTA